MAEVDVSVEVATEPAPEPEPTTAASVELPWTADTVGEASKGELVTFMQANCSAEFLSKHNLNGQAKVITKKSKAPALQAAYTEVLADPSVLVSADAKAAEIEAAAKEKAAQEAAAAAAAAATAAAAGTAAPGAKGKEKKGFKKRTTKKAPSGAKTPTVGDNVRVMYKGTLEDGCVATRTARKWIADFAARCRATIGTIVIVSLSDGCAGLCSTRAQALTPRPPRSGSRCSLRLDKGV